MVVISVSLPEALLEAMDKYASKYGYTGRSELIREAVRDLVSQDLAPEPGEESFTVIFVLTDKRHKHDADERVLSTVHRYEDMVRVLHHYRLDQNLCVNLVITQGPQSRSGELARKLRGIRGVVDVWIKHVTPAPHQL